MNRKISLAVICILPLMLAGCWTVSGALLGGGIGGAAGGRSGALVGTAIGAGVGSVADNLETRSGRYYRSRHYQPRGHYPLARKHLVRVLNGTHWVCRVYTDAHAYVELYPGGQADIEYPRFKRSYRIYLTANFFNEDGRLIGTAKDRFRIPDWDDWGVSQDIWHITRYRDLK